MRTVAPLDELPAGMQEEIAFLVAQDSPPPRWKRLWELAQIQSRAWWEWYAQRGRDPERIREALPRAFRESIVVRDRGVCQLCMSEIGPGDEVHIDHIIPVVLGGENFPGNLQLAHGHCNIRKGARKAEAA